MAASKKKKSSKSSSGPWLSEESKRIIRVVTGVIFGIVTVYTIVALVSYMFTWTADQSLKFNHDLSSVKSSAANSGGKLGFLWADLLISKLFGVGAFILPVFIGAISLACFRVKRINLLRILMASLFGAILCSVVFAYIFSFFPILNAGGNGAGGSYGYYANYWLTSMLGSVGQGCLLAVLVFIYLLLLTPKVAFWFDDLVYGITHRTKKEEEPLAEDSPDGLEEMGQGGDLPDEVEQILGAGFDEIDDNPVLEIESPQPAEEVEVEGGAQEEGGVSLKIETSENDFISNLDSDEDAHLYDPRLDLPRYEFPSVSLLNDYRDKWYEVSRDELEKNKQRIVNALDSYRIKVTAITAKMGPTVTLYKIHLADGVKVAQVRSLEEDIAISLGAKGVRVVTLLDSVGIEVANERPSVVALKAILNSPQYKESNMELPMAMGITVTNEPFFIDLAKMPHLLVAGATGMGKSVGLNVMIASLLFAKHPAEMKMVLVDPKKVELSLYSKLEKHFLAMLPDGDEAIITDTKKVVSTLKSLCIEMDARYDLLKAADVRQIKEYNQKFLNRRLNPEKGHKYLPYIVVIIDEFADLLMTAGREIEEPIARLAQKARAIGIHLIIATQRPTTNIITGTIKANFNSRIGFKVNSGVDSKTILDSPGAHRLIGRGDMLVIHPGADLTRVQCALIDTPEIIDLVKSVSSQKGYEHAFYLPEVAEDGDEGPVEVDLHKRDALFEECAKLVVQTQQGSTSMFQRKLGIGYARAGRIMDQLEAAGIVGPQEGSKARNVYISDFDALDKLFETLNHI